MGWVTLAVVPGAAALGSLVAGWWGAALGTVVGLYVTAWVTGEGA